MKLKQCPFCGGDAVLVREYNGVEANTLGMLIMSVGCTVCGASTRKTFTDDSAMRAWNRRAEDEDK